MPKGLRKIRDTLVRHPTKLGVVLASSADRIHDSLLAEKANSNLAQYLLMHPCGPDDLVAGGFPKN
jgi:hypothetical protein